MDPGLGWIFAWLLCPLVQLQESLTDQSPPPTGGAPRGAYS